MYNDNNNDDKTLGPRAMVTGSQVRIRSICAYDASLSLARPRKGDT